MSRFAVVSLIYIIVAAASLTSGFASRPLWSKEVPSDRGDGLTVISKSGSAFAAADVTSTQFQVSSTPTVESDKVLVDSEHEGLSTDGETKELLEDEMGPCVEETDSGRKCDRMLSEDDDDENDGYSSAYGSPDGSSKKYSASP